MVGVVIVAHGRLAAEMLQSLESVLGSVEGVEAVDTGVGDGAEDVRRRIRDAVHRVASGDGVVILTDMLGDTATNQSLAIARETGAEVVAGVNMPILVKVTTARAQMDSASLARFIQRYGQEHIFWATQPPARARQAR